MMQLIDIIQTLSEKEQEQVLDFVKKLIAEKDYTEKINSLKQVKNDHLFQRNMEEVFDDFFTTDFE